MFNAHPTIFRFPVLGLLSSFIFVWIDLTGCTKKKLNFSIPILISNFLRQMRYRWNRHHSYIVNIVFSNNLQGDGKGVGSSNQTEVPGVVSTQ